MNQTGKRGQRRTFGTRGPGLNQQGGEDAPGTKTGLSSGRSSIASPWMISFAWTPSLKCFERFLSFHCVLCSSPSGGRLLGLFTHYPGPGAPTASSAVKSRSPLILGPKPQKEGPSDSFLFIFCGLEQPPCYFFRDLAGQYVVRHILRTLDTSHLFSPVHTIMTKHPVGTVPCT